MNRQMVRFRFAGLHGMPAECGIERIDLSDGGVVIIATELADNPDASVTNAAEFLATAVCAFFRIDPAKLVWVSDARCRPMTW